GVTGGEAFGEKAGVALVSHEHLLTRIEVIAARLSQKKPRRKRSKRLSGNLLRHRAADRLMARFECLCFPGALATSLIEQQGSGR
ncbi:MAG TPA: hypothetical protein VGC40_02680, partial [Paenirhodobacter sp.]